MTTTLHTDHLTLYHFTTCPFCLRVRMAIKCLGLDLACKNTRQDREAHAELVAGGGRSMVPCLRIENPDNSVTWMYESADIVRYLKKEFGS